MENNQFERRFRLRDEEPRSWLGLNNDHLLLNDQLLGRLNQFDEGNNEERESISEDSDDIEEIPSDASNNTEKKNVEDIVNIFFSFSLSFINS